MIITAVDMYQNLLELYNKVRTGSVTIAEFNRRINLAQNAVVTKKYLDAVQANQKRVDDLSDITILDEIINNTGASVAGGELFLLQSQVANIPYYLHMLTVLVKIQYVNNDCHSGISTWQQTKVMKSDFRADASIDPFRKAKDSRIYYRIDKVGANKYVKIFTGTSSYATQVKIDYLRYPKNIFVDPNNIAHVDCELTVEVREEVVRECLRELLENTESPRFNTNTQRTTEIQT